MYKSNVPNTTSTSETVTTLHQDARHNRGRYKRQPSRAGQATFKGKWQQQLDAARVIWNQLTVEEILNTGGSEQKLTDLVQERYACTRAEAYRQVSKFLKQIR